MQNMNPMGGQINPSLMQAMMAQPFPPQSVNPQMGPGMGQRGPSPVVPQPTMAPAANPMPGMPAQPADQQPQQSNPLQILQQLQGQKPSYMMGGGY